MENNQAYNTYKLSYYYVEKSFGHEKAIRIRISKLSVTNNGQYVTTKEIKPIIIDISAKNTKTETKTKVLCDMRPYYHTSPPLSELPKRLLYAPDYFKKLTTTPCGINLYGTFHIFGSKEKITRAFKSLPLLIQHTHNIKDFNSPNFKILIDYYKEENPTSWQEFINRTMDTL